MADRGWFKMRGRPGARTLAEQMEGLQPALAECAGKSVLDLGCAEGLISLEFAKAGAASILGVEREPQHIEVAQTLRFPGACVARFMRMNLKTITAADCFPHDIVLCLAIIHKLEVPEIGLRFAARSARDLLLLRSGAGSIDGIIYGKYSRTPCDSAAVMRNEGFTLERTCDGAEGRDQPVEYWRRTHA